MTRAMMLMAGCLFCLSSVALAEDSGGVRVSPNIGAGPVGLARPLLSAMQPLVTAHDVQASVTATDRSAKHQDMITKLRGDAGYLAGFSYGVPLAASRQVPVGGYDGAGESGGWYPHHSRAPRQIIINNEGPLAITNGSGNVVQQQAAFGNGPTAQQQVAQPTAGATGASNIIMPSGAIVQRPPGAR